MFKQNRASGVLLHPTSLPSPEGIGTIGAPARRFVDLLQAMGQRYWQVLPLSPTGYGNSPYQTQSSFAGSPLLIDLEPLVEWGCLEAAALDELRDLPTERVDFERLIPRKWALLNAGVARLQERMPEALRHAYDGFREHHQSWLHEYCLYAALKEAHDGRPWTEWAPELVRRAPEALEAARSSHAQRIEQLTLLQFLFSQQWQALRAYAAEHGIGLIGDIPIFVAHDSADVWARQDLFQLDGDGQPTAVAGVPPDYFSATGQLWGNPLYAWPVHTKEDFAWWRQRLHHCFDLYDLVRIDHFRGFDAYWSVPAGEETAINGEWVEAPGAALFERLREDRAELPVIAEDLGIITDQVVALRQRFGLPGMRVMQFAMGTDVDNPHLPENHSVDSVCYTGTHDNDTTVGWWTALSPKEKAELERRFRPVRTGLPIPAMSELLVEACLSSPAALAILPMQDWLGLGSEARMNVPGQAGGNWEWRIAAAFPNAAWAADVARRVLSADR